MAAQDVYNFTGLYENKLISECIQDAFFKNKRSVGVEFQAYFDPISLATIALALTTVCLIIILFFPTDVLSDRILYFRMENRRICSKRI